MSRPRCLRALRRDLRALRRDPRALHRQPRALRRTALVAVLLFAGTLPAGAAPSAPAPPVPRTPDFGAQAGPVVYWAPLPSVRVVHGFDPPATPYGPGHLGVDLATSSGAVVRAAATGVVAFAGPVAGRTLIVLRHPDGITTEYEPVRPAAGIVAGRAVTRGAPLGVVDGTHDGCLPGRCLHWGAKRGDSYLDPLSLLVPLGPVRLLPWGAPRPGWRGS